MSQESGGNDIHSIKSASKARGNRGSMKIIASLMFCFFILVSGNVFGTPSPSDWYKADLIGTNDTHYFYYLTHEELPGSYYYSFTHRYLVSRNILTGTIDKKIRLETTKHTSDMEDAGGETKITTKDRNMFRADVNPSAVLGGNNVKTLKPDADARRDFKFDGKGMYYIRNKKKIYVLAREYLNKFLPDYGEWFDDDEGISTINVYSNPQYYFYILKYGIGGDIDLFQEILPVSRSVFK